MTAPPGRGCEADRASPHRARAPGVGVWAAPGDGPAAGAPRLLGSGAVRGPAGVGRVAAGAMEGVLYKWTNYLSGEWPRRARGALGAGPLSVLREGGVWTRPGRGSRPFPEASVDREYFPKQFSHGTVSPCWTTRPSLGIG